MSANRTVKVQVKRRYKASAETIFDSFLNPEKARKFLFATSTGEMIKAEIDPKVGGAFVFIDRRPEGDAEHHGTYLKIDRPKSLVFKFAVQKNAAEADPVTIDITPREKGCELTLTHEMSSKYETYADQVELGWMGILESLARI